ncbi:MAG: AbrB/MazE/SpoVT family DNA-binding domain-containing protein [Kiritimatiellae bacterium]|jgi:antitoxin MazE|nr:AbrB/MazE/SpoVT family DNA-binding domain-containing protein [Kiritimatiellia bacterium]
MITKVQGWGNSQGLRLNKQILKEANISVGDEVDLCVREGAIVIEPVKRLRGAHTLEELVSKIPADYKPSEVNWGEPSGMEAW